MLRSALLAATVLALLPLQAQAQLELKPAVGMTLTSLSKNPAGATSSAQVGYQVGASVLFGRSLYAEGGLFYARKSTEFTIASGVPAPKISTDITGLRIPVMVGYHLIGGPTEFFALRAFGGAAAFMVTDVTVPGLTKKDFSSPTYGVFAGAGVDVLFLFADLKYEWSLTDTSKLSSVGIGQARSLFVNVGAKFNF
jgi:hypothetical protein